MAALLHLTYFPNVAHLAVMLQNDEIYFEHCDTYMKQTYRNRCCIMTANGLQQLNIPVIHSQKDRQLYKQVAVSNAEQWQSVHLKSLESAYRKSPFFEYYIDDIAPLFKKDVDNLFQFNLNCLEVIFECLQLPLNYQLTETFSSDHLQLTDYRNLVYCKKEIAQSFGSYIQVFNNKYDFIGNLSILDVLFNEGPNTVNYLKSQHVKIQ